MYREGESREYNPRDDAGPIIEGEVISEHLELGNNPEASAEQTPGSLVEAGILPAEKKNATDAVISSKWSEKAREFFKTPGGEVLKGAGVVTGVGAGLFAIWLLKDIYFIWKFAKVMIEKGGKMTYADGKKIAEDTFSALGVGGDKKK